MSADARPLISVWGEKVREFIRLSSHTILEPWRKWPPETRCSSQIASGHSSGVLATWSSSVMWGSTHITAPLSVKPDAFKQISISSFRRLHFAHHNLPQMRISFSVKQDHRHEIRVGLCAVPCIPQARRSRPSFDGFHTRPLRHFYAGLSRYHKLLLIT